MINGKVTIKSSTEIFTNYDKWTNNYLGQKHKIMKIKYLISVVFATKYQILKVLKKNTDETKKEIRNFFGNWDRKL